MNPITAFIRLIRPIRVPSLWLICCISLLVFSSTQSQPLPVLLELADAQNPRLKALDQAYRADLEKAPQVSQLPHPEIGVGGFALPVETRLGAQRARLSASQMFPWLGTLQARKDLAITQAQAKGEQIGSQRLEMHHQIKIAWFSLYEITASQKIIRRNISILESLKALTKSKVETGQASLADVLRVDLKIQEMSHELLIFDAKRRKPLAALNQLLNRALDTPVETSDTLTFADLPFGKDTLMTHIHAHHPKIKAFSLQQEAARKSIVVNQREGRPSFGVGMDYLLVNPRSDALPTNNGRDILQVKATLSIPLSRKKYAARTREENLRIQALDNQIQEAETRFLAAIENAYADYESAALMQELYDRQISTTQSAIRILEADYSTNNSHFDELLRLESELINYDLKNLRAIIQSQIAKASIERYLHL